MKFGEIDLRNIRDRKYSNLENNRSAYQYGNYLIDKEIGFMKIGTEKSKTYEPKKGDIVIFDKTDKHKDGHMAMFDGINWISDFKQKDIWGGNIRQENPSYIIYRNPKWVE